MKKSANDNKKKAPKPNLRLGEILVKSGLINSNQLQQVLKRQTQVGGHLGSILIELRFLMSGEISGHLLLLIFA